MIIAAASWSGGRVQDSGLGSRSSSEFTTLPVRLLVVPLSKALHTALLLSTQEQMGTCEGRFVSRGAKLRVSGCILPRELRWISKWIYGLLSPNDQGRYLSKSAEQSSEPGCGLKPVTLLLIAQSKCDRVLTVQNYFRWIMAKHVEKQIHHYNFIVLISNSWDSVWNNEILQSIPQVI